jgi:formylglycine-generating enzyme required for sulfatase activity
MEEEIQNSIGMKLVLIPAGEFMMGASPGDKDADDNEKPRHKVKITKPFYMGKTPVTQEQYEKLMGTNPSAFNGKNPDYDNRDAGKKAPVENVSWDDAQEFIRMLNQKEGTKGYRLPTEAQWEYAARAGSTTKYYWGDSEEDIVQYAWTSESELESTKPVMKKDPNAFGLYDMLGNVLEWCEDWYNEDYYSDSELNDPKGPEEGEYRVLRGGSWNINARYSRLSNRLNFNPDSRDNYYGFRLLLLP